MRRIVAVVLVASVSLGIGACSASGGSDSSPPTTSAAGQPIVLADLVTSRDELRDGETMSSPPAARNLDTASLVYCGQPFPSEGLRTARHQVVVRDEGADWTSVTEAVRYSPGGAGQAVAEMRAAFVDCPEDEFVDPGPGASPSAVPQRHDAFPLADEDLVDVADDHVAARVTISHEDGSATTSYLVLQRRGDVAVTTIATDQDRVIELAGAVGRRLAAAPARSLGD